MVATGKRIGYGDERNAKKIKVGGHVEERCLIVQEAVGSAHLRTNMCQVMLEAMLPGSLGVPVDERQDLQVESMVIIGKVMDELLKDVEETKELHQAMVDDLSGTKAKMENDKVDGAKDVAAADKRLADRAAALDAATKARHDAEAATDAAERERKDAEDHLEELVNEIKKYEDAYNEHFIPLKQGSWAARSEATMHINALTPLFKKFDYEESLMCSFPPAAYLRPPECESFDKITMVEAEKGFTKHLASLRKQKAAAEPVLRKAEQNLKAKELAEAEAKVREIAAGVEKAKAAQNASNKHKAQEKLENQLQNYPKTPEEARAQLAEAEAELDEFKDKVYEAYVWLRDRVSSADV